jgi:hypothetical protein
MDEKCAEPLQTERMVEGTGSKDDRTLPIFWNERKQAHDVQILPKYIKISI